ncbi:hypothetical protein EST38_g13293 [Candolleomyces aberdarensis]|uniref:Uncharacterized protein n=1 Tax=Candolleomyces aberdarensis TaxID=2316362 RepID=A0A4Q2D2K5_9AGAR|nr:hypothetical protein EST38_g13293 [Candolleomyces aberdarensis]
MLSALIKAQLSFNETVLLLLEEMEAEELQQKGSMRPGGRVVLDDLGDRVWLEQFRYAMDSL